MANNPSAEKRIRINARKRSIKIAHMSALRTAVKRYLRALEEDQANAPAYLQTAIKALDKAAAKGVIHKNAAARRKSRLTKKLANLA